ncbi:MAG: hypothetical protein ABJA94_03220 [Rhodoglobus sp.]
MRALIDEQVLAQVLPGGWTIAATNLPMWLSGERQSPHFAYELLGESPLLLAGEVSYATAEGEQKQITGQDAWGDGEFSRRGKGLQRVFVSRWIVSGVSDDGAIVVLHYSKSLATPDGIDVLVRDGAGALEVRTTIARATEEFGLTPEEFGSLSWLQPSS